MCERRVSRKDFQERVALEGVNYPERGGRRRGAVIRIAREALRLHLLAYLFESRNQACWIASQLRPILVRVVFVGSVYPQLHECRADRDQYCSHQEQDERAVPLPVPVPTESPEPHRVERDVSDVGYRSSHRRGYARHQDIPVNHVPVLMANHNLKLVGGQCPQDSRCRADHGLLGPPPRREGVRLSRLDYAYLRHGHPGLLGDPPNDPEERRVITLLNDLRPAHPDDDRIAIVVRDEVEDSCEDESQPREEVRVAEVKTDYVSQYQQQSRQYPKQGGHSQVEGSRHVNPNSESTPTRKNLSKEGALKIKATSYLSGVWNRMTG